MTGQPQGHAALPITRSVPGPAPASRSAQPPPACPHLSPVPISARHAFMYTQK